MQKIYTDFHALSAHRRKNTVLQYRYTPASFAA
jgi:hypothetical protein